MRSNPVRAFLIFHCKDISSYLNKFILKGSVKNSNKIITFGRGDVCPPMHKRWRHRLCTYWLNLKLTFIKIKSKYIRTSGTRRRLFGQYFGEKRIQKQGASIVQTFPAFGAKYFDNRTAAACPRKTAGRP